jgi:hypothetical protein
MRSLRAMLRCFARPEGQLPTISGGSGQRILFSLITSLLLATASCGTAYAGSAPASRGESPAVASKPAFLTLLGASGSDSPLATTTDARGDIYVTGYTTSGFFPTTPGAYDPTFNGTGGWGDAFVAKFDSGGRLMYSTFLGGSVGDQGEALSVDGSGSVTIVGLTSSPDFPTTPSAYDSSHNGGLDAFVARLSADGSTLEYATFLGGASDDHGQGVAGDPRHGLVVAGITRSADFPTTPGAFDRGYNGDVDTFVVQFSPDGSSLTGATYLGGSLGDGVLDNSTPVGVDAFGDAYLVGTTSSTDFPTTPGVFDPIHNGEADIFVAKVNLAGGTLIYSTFVGTTGIESGISLSVDQHTGIAFFTGWTNSPAFPTTSSAFDQTHNGGDDTIVVELSADGSDLVFSSFLGGSDYDLPTGIALQSDGALDVTGWTTSPNFPTTANCFQCPRPGGRDAFLARLTRTGGDLRYSTYVGGSGDDYGFALATGWRGDVIVAGTAGSVNFPTSPRAFQRTYNGSDDAFVMSIKLG